MGRGYKCQLSVKNSAICQLSVKYLAICQLSVNWLLIINHAVELFLSDPKQLCAKRHITENLKLIRESIR